MNHRSSYSGTLTQRYDDYAMKHLAGIPHVIFICGFSNRNSVNSLQACSSLLPLASRYSASCTSRTKAGSAAPRALLLHLIHSICNTNVGVAAAGTAGAYLLS